MRIIPTTMVLSPTLEAPLLFDSWEATMMPMTDSFERGLQ
jgi:hypothetical protein